MSDTANHLTEIAQHSPGLKAAVAATGVGGATTAANASIEWTTYAGFGLTALGLFVSIGSIYIGYLNLQEKRRENDLKERALNGCNDND